jgi:hypothetical protein
MKLKDFQKLSTDPRAGFLHDDDDLNTILKVVDKCLKYHGLKIQKYEQGGHTILIIK